MASRRMSAERRKRWRDGVYDHLIPGKLTDDQEARRRRELVELGRRMAMRKGLGDVREPVLPRLRVGEKAREVV